MSREDRSLESLRADRAQRRTGRRAVLGAVLAGLAVAGCDGGNLFGVGGSRGPQIVSFIVDGVEIIEPTTGSGVPLSDSVLVQANVQHPRDVLEVVMDGVAHRGSRDLGTHQMVQRFEPRTIEIEPLGDTLLARFLQPTNDDTSEEVWIRVFATDELDFVAADSVLIQMGGPRVSVPDLTSGQTVSGGQTLVLRVLAEDPIGVDIVEVVIAGALSPPVFQETAFTGQDPTDVEAVFNYVVPAGVNGTITIVARARNENGILGQAPTITLTVSSVTGVDTTAPEVRTSIVPQGAPGDSARVEATDPIRVSLTTRDNTGGTGVVRTGYTVRIVPRRSPADTVWVTDEVIGAATGTTVTRTFNPTLILELLDPVDGLPVFDPVARPDTLDLDFFGYAFDAAVAAGGGPAPNCAASVSATGFQQLACGTVVYNATNHVVATGQNGQRVTIVLVNGETVRLPAGGRIADAVVDTTTTGRDPRVYVANIGLSRLEVFDIPTRTFGAPVLVGAEPWGLAFDRTNPNRLLVANSGGTNLSFVDLTALSEVADRRIFTPNQVLYNINESTNDAGASEFLVSAPFDFSDRPQFVEMDQNGRIVYSTKPTEVATPGTVRIAQLRLPTERPQVVMFTDYAVLPLTPSTYAVSNVVGAFGGPQVILSAFEPFTLKTLPPNEIFTVGGPYSAAGAPVLAVAELAGLPEFNPTVPEIFRPRVRGGQSWPGDLGLNDTTFIAGSGIGNRIAIGEGVTAPTGRIILWDANSLTPSRAIEVIDLVNNAAERVLGAALGYDGDLGVARGIFAAYFFDPELRLQGQVAISAGGGGVALHPLHTVNDDGTQPVGSRLAFVPVGNRTIEIYDTFHFTRLGKVHVRDVISGPLRAVLPFAGENPATCTDNGAVPVNVVAVAGETYQGIDYSDPALDLDPLSATNDLACIVVKLTGATQGGGVVVVDVTVQDIISGP